MNAATPPAAETVVTVNNRLARALAAAHGEAMLASGAQAWETPRVVPFDVFVASEWAAACEKSAASLPRLLGAVEVRALWQESLAASGLAGLLSPGAAAASAARARDLLLRYAVDLTPARCGEHPDALDFLRWHARYQDRLAAGGWTDPAAAATRLAGLVRDGVATVPGSIHMVGFDRLTPQQRSLLEVYRGAGARVLIDEPPPGPMDACRICFDSPAAEIEAAARWARALLESGEAGPIGIVVPDLAGCVDAVDACFEDVLHPGLTLAPHPGTGSRAFNVSLGRALAQVPVVADALAALRTALGTVQAEDAGRALLSVYLAGAQVEQRARLALEARLRDEGVRRIRTRHLARLAARDGASLFAATLRAASELAPHLRARDSLDVHASRFARMLTAAGWPSGRSLDSGEYQAAEAFRVQLQALGAAAAVMRPCTASAALMLLERMLGDATFQPRAAPAPVQVLGTLEAAGMRFRRLWISGMHDAAWPPTESPNPLLPLPLQRENAMPGACPEQSLERARRLTARLLGAAPAVVVSHARADGDEALRVSPLLQHLPVMSAHAVPGSAIMLADVALAQAAPTLERLPDWRAREVGHGWRARGGSRVLTDQAACPFRAFARHRLAAEGVARAAAPLDARSRGILAHRLMQALFQSLSGHAAVLALDAAARRERAATAAEEAVAAVVRRHPGEVSQRLAQAERERLAAMACRWLELEAARAPFQVEAVEQRRKVRVGGLSLDIQLDRIDRVHGRRLLMDYKTGRARRGAWFGERPDEPQLPLYALALDADGGAAAPVAAVCFARLRRGEEGFEGVAEDPLWAPGLVGLGSGPGGQKDFADMPALKLAWADVLGRLAEAFARGDAAVDPKRGACRYCDIRPLCRVDAVLAAWAGEDAE